tara:strand:- start:168 stop:377 length:210 start_codon:yes stop_codon:yes gene_type:complete
MGIGPNNLGPDGKSGYTSCGHPKRSPLKKTVVSLDGPGQSPLAFNEKLEAAVDSGKITGKFAEAIKKGE